MTSGQSDWLSEIREVLSQIAKQQQINTNAIAHNASEINELKRTITLHQHYFEISQRNFDAAQRNFEIVQADIRGLQLENRRMLEEMRGRNEQ